MLKGVFYFLKGYVIIKVEGNFPERFLNVAGRRQMLLWDVKAVKDGILLKAPASDFPKMQAVAESCGCTVKALGKIGLPFVIRRHAARKAMLYGLLLCVLTVFAMLSLLWEVRVTGCERIAEAEIRALLKENGISPFSFVCGIDKTRACQNIAAKNANIAWIGIEIKGSCAFVEIVETVPKPVIRDPSVPCNLVSTKSGVITGLQVKSGNTVVAVGDTVTEGQLLVSGIAESAMNGVRFLHADGDVFIRVWHEKTVDIPLKREVRVSLLKQQKKYALRLFGLKIPLYVKAKPKFETFDVQTEKWGVIETDVYKAVQIKTEIITEAEAVQEAENAFLQELSAFGEVEQCTHTVTKHTADAISVHFVAEVIEKTGEKRMIEGENNGENFAG